MKNNISVNLLVYDLLKKDANEEYIQKKYDRACRKYEEALGCFRYYESTDPNWKDSDLNDGSLKNVDILGYSKI